MGIQQTIKQQFHLCIAFCPISFQAISVTLCTHMFTEWIDMQTEQMNLSYLDRQFIILVHITLYSMQGRQFLFLTPIATQKVSVFTRMRKWVCLCDTCTNSHKHAQDNILTLQTTITHMLKSSITHFDIDYHATKMQAKPIQ